MKKEKSIKNNGVKMINVLFNHYGVKYQGQKEEVKNKYLNNELTIQEVFKIFGE